MLECLLMCFVILQLIFVKFYLWNPLGCEDMSGIPDQPRAIFYVDFLIWGFQD